MIRIGMFGAGTIAAVHAEAICKSDRAQLAAVYSPVGADAIAAICNAKVAASADEILNDPSIDAVLIVSPPGTHFEYLKLAHKAGKHILSEKPIVRTEEQLQEIEKLFAGYDKVVAVGHILKFAAEYQHLREVAQQDKLGNIGTIRMGRGCGLSPMQNQWTTDFKQSGGVILDMMLHDLYSLEWSFGPIERVFAMRTGGDQKITTDYALAVLRLKSGAIAHLEASWVEQPGVFYYYYEIAGSKGILELDSRDEPLVTLALHDPAERARPGNPRLHSAFDGQLADFVDAIENKRPPTVGLDQGIRAVRLCLALLKSAAEGQSVAV